VSLGLIIIAGFDLGGRDISDRLEEASIVEPVDPFEGGELDGLEVAARSAPMDDLGLVEAVDRLGEGVVEESPTLPTEGTRPASIRRSVYLIDTYWTPRSLWWTRPSPRTGLRSCRACSSASRTKPAWAVRDTRQPTILRAKASMTKAT